MTAVIDSPNEQSRTWVVDVASRRIVRQGNRPSKREDGQVSGWDELNPLNDLKAAARVAEGAHPLKSLREALEIGAELLEPAESDLRVIPVDPDSVSESVEDRSAGKGRPMESHPLPDARELGKERQMS